MVPKVGYHSYTEDTGVEVSRTCRDQVELAGELTGAMVDLAGRVQPHVVSAHRRADRRDGLARRAILIAKFFLFNSAAKHTCDILPPCIVSTPRGVGNLRHRWNVEGIARMEFNHGVPTIVLYDIGRSMTKNSVTLVTLPALTTRSIEPRVIVAFSENNIGRASGVDQHSRYVDVLDRLLDDKEIVVGSGRIGRCPVLERNDIVSCWSGHPVSFIV
ncbi:hypothetical protein DY000_02032920 [Brassica cretica]|uniref:Uncharacterized protein n=1 Tax=Brassica cretica TaxID=69181 RepID=A0ABQ7DHT7_BRACR|nr:hypothetical protein DY000_02032920 [Brassica cretica]